MKRMNAEDTLKIAMAQIAPVWLNKEKTIDKVKQYISEAANLKSDLIVFGEGLLPGYPFWLSFTNGSSFNDQTQKEIHAHYLRNAIQIEAGDLEEITALIEGYNYFILYDKKGELDHLNLRIANVMILKTANRKLLSVKSITPIDLSNLSDILFL